MPRKRVPAARRESPEARALRAAVLEELRQPLVERSAKAEAKAERKSKEWLARVMARGGGLPAALDELERDLRKLTKRMAKAAAITPPAYVPRAETERPVPEPKPATAVDELAERRKRRTRRPPGFAGYIDPRLFDGDEWDD